MPTIKDVARESGLAVGTVSRVLNNKNVKEVNRLKVEAAIKKLNYEVNTYARGLKMQHTYTIALIIPTVWNPFFAAITYYIELELTKRDYKLFLCNSDNNVQKEVSYINMAKQNKVDGIIAITYSDIDAYVQEDLPIVSIDRHFSHIIPCVASDNTHGGKIAANKLLDLGCKRLAFISTGSSIDSETNNRKHGFVSGCKARGIEPIIYELIEPFDNLSLHLQDFIKEHFLGSSQPIDGIFAVTDLLALTMVNELAQFNISVPNDVQIIGFDGIKNFIDDVPVVSSIKQPVDLIAQKSVEVLLSMIDKQPVSHSSILPVEFIQGKTTLS